MRKFYNHDGFTLIELMVVITIIFIVTLASYMPYAHHQKKLLINQAAREISQWLSEARNLALHGLNTWSGNLNIWLFFWSWATNLVYYTSTGTLSLWTLDPNDIYKAKTFPRWVTIDSIDGINTDFLFVYDAISGDITITPNIASESFDIDISYNKSASSVLQKHIHYYKKSYISEY